MMRDIMILAEELSVNKQFELISLGYTMDGRHASSYTIIVRDKPRSIYIDIGTSGKYIYDKNKGLVYSIKGYGQKNRLIGTPNQVSSQLAAESNQLASFTEKKYGSVLEPKPVVKIEDKKSFNIKISEGSIFRNSWGYGMIHNEYVMVIRDKEKTVDVIKLQNQKLTGGPYWQQGTERPIIPKSIQGMPRFQLKKDVGDEGDVYLRGADKSFEYRSDPVTWFRWDGQPNTYDYMD